ncbi:MAG TPA: outer membrane beta-barrel protein [Thermoanaerobaculia bacterium]|jgi:outer membrane protein W|nr:outer membrane beta-barrel protein [Thermoanaerobaculia bacterium]
MKTATTLIISLILAAPVLADDTITLFGGGFSRERITTVASSTPPPIYTPTGKTETQWNGEIGLAASHSWNKWWSTEASIAYRQSHAYVSEFIATEYGNVPATVNREVRTFPIDASMLLHVVNESRWKPYVSAGARYVNASNVAVNDFTPDANGSFLVRTKRADDRLSAEVGAGMTVMLTRTLGIRGDVKHLLRTDHSPFDPNERTSFGLEWKH